MTSTCIEKVMGGHSSPVHYFENACTHLFYFMVVDRPLICHENITTSSLRETRTEQKDFRIYHLKTYLVATLGQCKL